MFVSILHKLALTLHTLLADRVRRTLALVLCIFDSSRHDTHVFTFHTTTTALPACNRFTRHNQQNLVAEAVFRIARVLFSLRHSLWAAPGFVCSFNFFKLTQPVGFQKCTHRKAYIVGIPVFCQRQLL